MGYCLWNSRPDSEGLQLLNNTLTLENEEQKQVNLITQLTENQQQNPHLKEQQQQQQQRQQLHFQKESQSGLVESKKTGTKIKGASQNKSQFNQEIKDKLTLKIS